MTNLGWIAYIIATAALGIWVYRRFRQSSLGFADSTLGALLSGAAAFYLPIFLLGALGLMVGRGLVRPEYLLPLFAVFCLALARSGLAQRLASTWRSALLDKPLPEPIGPAGRWGVILAAAFGISIIPLLLLQFPRGTEPVAYHLPLAVWTLQSNSIDFWDRVFVHTVPYNASLLYAAVLGTGWERAVNIVNIPLTAGLVLALYKSAASLGGKTSTAAVLAVGTASIPIIAFSAMECGADIGMMLFLAIAFYLLVLATRTQNGLLAASAGVAAGLAAGYKTSGLIYLGLIALFPLFASKRRHSAFVILSIFLVSGTVLAAVWWGRNWWVLGNPFHPVAIPVISDLLGWPAPVLDPEFHAKIQNQWVRSSFEWLAYPWIEWHDIDQNFKHSSGLGAFFAAVLPVTIIWSCFRLASGTAPERHFVAILGGYLIVSTLVWWHTGREPRYWIPNIIFLIPLSAVLLARLSPPNARTVHWILVGCTAAMLGLFFVREILVFGDRIVYSRHYIRDRAFGYPKSIDTLPPRSVIVNVASRDWHYPLAGAALGNRIISSVLACQDLLGVHTWGFANCGQQPLTLDAAMLHQWSATHLFSEGEVQYESRDGTRLRKIDALTHNPVNGIALPAPRVLYEIVYAPESSSR